ncbi:hypothetical protein Scep_030625 [Stephania cephalantha]|uniref:Uncharacterized protein n=1 Tax=Stephania cephalantha TaxID=152367 RepID=A0AAP0DZZ4_9MAGN
MEIPNESYKAKQKFPKIAKLPFRRAKRWNLAEKRRSHSKAVSCDLHVVSNKPIPPDRCESYLFLFFQEFATNSWTSSLSYQDSLSYQESAS